MDKNEARAVLSLDVVAANQEMNELDALLSVLLMATEEDRAVHTTLMQCRRKLRRIAGTGTPAGRLSSAGKRGQHAVA